MQRSSFPISQEGSTTWLIRELNSDVYNPITDRNEVASLVLRYQQHGDMEARNKLVCSHLRFVARRANMLMKPNNPNFMDIFQEGVIGFIKACEKYEDRGYKLYSYAVWWVSQAMQQHIDLLSGQPIDFNITLDQMVESGDEPNWDPLSEWATAKKDFVDHCLATFFEHLTLREYAILKFHYGLDPIVGRPLKLKELGEMFGLHLERVRQIIKQSLNTLKQCNPEWYM